MSDRYSKEASIYIIDQRVQDQLVGIGRITCTLNLAPSTVYDRSHPEVFIFRGLRVVFALRHDLRAEIVSFHCINRHQTMKSVFL